MSWTPEQRARYAARAAGNRRWRLENDPAWNERRRAAIRKRYAERAAADPEWAARRREAARRAMAKFRAAHPERARVANRRFREKWRAERPLDYMLAQRAQYERHREKRLAYMKARHAANIERHKAVMRRARQADNARCAADGGYYAVRRAKARMWYAQKRIAQGRTYTPRPQCRVPDGLRMGVAERMASRSAFRADNLTAGQRAYARELARERRAQWA